jgi:hypothetical protein
LTLRSGFAALPASVAVIMTPGANLRILTPHTPHLGGWGYFGS